MQVNVNQLIKKSIDAALKENWDLVIEINYEILTKDPKNKDAKMSLGRAYVQTKKFSKATKIYQEILEVDPINIIAKKNYKLALSKTADVKNNNDKVLNSRSLIKQPGTTKQADIPIEPNIIKKLNIGDEIKLKSNKTCTKLFVQNSKKEIGNICEDFTKRMYLAKKDGNNITSSIIKVNDEKITILLRCNKPIFKADKQHEKPFMKKGAIVEPKLEIPEEED